MAEASLREKVIGAIDDATGDILSVSRFVTPTRRSPCRRSLPRARSRYMLSHTASRPRGASRRRRPLSARSGGTARRASPSSPSTMHSRSRPRLRAQPDRLRRDRRGHRSRRRARRPGRDGRRLRHARRRGGRRQGDYGAARRLRRHRRRAGRAPRHGRGDSPDRTGQRPLTRRLDY